MSNQQTKTQNLVQMQEQFAGALLQPAGVSEVLPMFIEHPYQGDRLALYRGNLTAIWLSALHNAFPVLYQLVGEEYFEQIARAFGRAHPSDSGDLNHFGARLPDFLKTIPDAADYPYFSDLASLEWQIHSAYYAEDVEILTLSGFLQAVGESGQDLGVAQLQLHPTANFYQSDWATVAIWLAHQPETEANYPADLAEPSLAIISRPNWSAVVTPLCRAAWSALTALQQGSNLAIALEIAVDLDADFVINTNLQAWFSAGLFSSVKFIEDKV